MTEEWNWDDVERMYLLKNQWTFEQTMKNENCKVQKSKFKR